MDTPELKIEGVGTILFHFFNLLDGRIQLLLTLNSTTIPVGTQFTINEANRGTVMREATLREDKRLMFDFDPRLFTEFALQLVID